MTTRMLQTSSLFLMLMLMQPDLGLAVYIKTNRCVCDYALVGALRHSHAHRRAAPFIQRV